MQSTPEITLLQELIEQQEQPVVLCSATGEIRYANRSAQVLNPSGGLTGATVHLSEKPYLTIGGATFTLEERFLRSPELRWFNIILQEKPSVVKANQLSPSSPPDSINNLLLQLSGSLLQEPNADKGIVNILESITQIGNYDASIIYPYRNDAFPKHIQVYFVQNPTIKLPVELLHPDKDTLDALVENIGPRARYMLRVNAAAKNELHYFQQVIRQSGLYAAIFVPIRSEQHIEGLLGLYSSKPFPLSQKKLDAVLVFFASALANIIRNMRIKQQIDSYIIAREEAEKQAHQTLTILKSLLENTPLVAIQEYDTQGKITYWNKHSTQLYGYSEKKALGSHLSDLFNNATDLIQQLNNVNLLKQPSLPTELYVKTKNGKKAWVISSSIPVLTEDRITTVYAMQVDITRIKEMEEQERIAKTALQQYSLQINRQNQELIEKEEALIQTNEVLRLNQHKLDQVIRELSERNYELDEFVHRVSHNIRSPFTSLLGVINIMHTYIDNPEMLKELMDKMVTSIKRLDRYVHTLLEYSQANRKAENIEEIAIEHLLEDCMDSLRYIDNFPRVRVSYNLPKEHVPFKSDATRLSIILSNLISNAIKYANVYKNDNRLEITVEISPEEGKFIIKDNGIGIRPELADKVFDMFFRAHEYAQGSGLGLYIVKQTVSRMGGKIEMQTEYGHGTTFTVTLPNHA
jgi:PAS domain S-box-containing protein